MYDFKDLGMSVSVDSSSIILVKQFLPDQSIWYVAAVEC